jgi:hypothetical protein
MWPSLSLTVIVTLDSPFIKYTTVDDGVESFVPVCDSLSVWVLSLLVYFSISLHLSLYVNHWLCYVLQ